MAELEKVIKGIDMCLSEKSCNNMECPYKQEGFETCIDSLKTDALELLKEQDRSKHGHWVVLENCSNAGVYCSECHTKMFDRYPMKKKFSQYCGHCGAHNDLQVEVR